MVMHHLWTSATDKDFFVAADNGAGYLNPGLLQQGLHPEDPRPVSSLPSGLEAWREHCQKYYTQWGLTVTGFIIDGFAPPMNSAVLDCYQTFSPNGIVAQKVPLTSLHKGMPILRSDYDLYGASEAAAKRILERIGERPIPFHWFRTILYSPRWHFETIAEMKKRYNSVEVLDAPTFFELYRRWLEQTPEAAAGNIPFPSPFGI